MKNYTPMPSPKGTNYSQLYVPWPAKADGAYDTVAPRAPYSLRTRYAYDKRTKCDAAEPKAGGPLCTNMQPETRHRVSDAIAKYLNISTDEDNMDDEDNNHWIEKVLEFCNSKLDNADMKELAKILHDAVDADSAMDEPPPFSGTPSPGGKIQREDREDRDAQDRKRRMAGDSADARRNFAQEFPMVARIKHAW